MRLTEKEADARWCPFSAARSVRTASGEREAYSVITNQDDGEGDVFVNCMGSRCMAWRWQDERRAFGYCGMAGEARV